MNKTAQQSSQGGESVSPFAADRIKDLEIKLNGQTIYFAPNESYKLINMIGEVGAGYFHNSIIGAGTVAPFTSLPVDTYFIMVDLSLLRPAFIGNHLQNTLRLAQQTLTADFYTSTDDFYQLHATYVYGTSIVQTLSSGETRIILG